MVEDQGQNNLLVNSSLHQRLLHFSSEELSRIFVEGISFIQYLGVLAWSLASEDLGSEDVDHKIHPKDHAWLDRPVFVKNGPNSYV